MDIGNVIQHVLTLTGTFNIWLILALFFLPLIGEFGVSLPYAVESIWLLAGYHVSTGATAPIFLVLCCLITLAGRQTGALVLYKISGFGCKPFAKFYNKLKIFQQEKGQPLSRFRRYILLPLSNLVIKNFKPSMGGEIQEDKTKKSIIKMQRLSSFRVAMGRFIWLKIPLTITTGITRQLSVLLLGVTIFSLAYDALYILMGVFGVNSGLEPLNMLLYMFGGFVFINLLIMVFKRLLRSNRLSPST